MRPTAAAGTLGAAPPPLVDGVTAESMGTPFRNPSERAARTRTAELAESRVQPQQAERLVGPCVRSVYPVGALDDGTGSPRSIDRDNHAGDSTRDTWMVVE